MKRPSYLRRKLRPACSFAYGIGYGFAAAGLAMVLILASCSAFFLVMGAFVLMFCAIPLILIAGVLDAILFFHRPVGGQVTAGYTERSSKPHRCTEHCPFAEYWLQVERKPGGRRRWFRVTPAQYYGLPVGSVFTLKTVRGGHMAILAK